MKKTLIKILIGLLIVVLAYLCYTSFSDPYEHVRIRNQADCDIYGYYLYYSFGEADPIQRRGDGGVSFINREPGSNIASPLPSGKTVELPLPRGEGHPFNETLYILMYVYDKPILSGEDSKLNNAARIGDVFQIPVREGKCSDILLTGNSTDGYTIEFIGISRKRNAD